MRVVFSSNNDKIRIVVMLWSARKSQGVGGLHHALKNLEGVRCKIPSSSKFQPILMSEDHPALRYTPLLPHPKDIPSPLFLFCLSPTLATWHSPPLSWPNPAIRLNPYPICSNPTSLLREPPQKTPERLSNWPVPIKKRKAKEGKKRFGVEAKVWSTSGESGLCRRCSSGERRLTGFQSNSK